MSDDRQRWNARYAERGAATWEPDAFLAAVEALLPRAGRALDLAGGTGRHALWLARRGLDVTLCDVSDEALRIAAARLEAKGVSAGLAAVDLATHPPPEGPWDVIVDFHYLQRDLFLALPQLLAPDGVFVFVQPTRRNLERHARPSERYLLEEGEIRSLVSELEILHLDEGWSDVGRHEARLVARNASGGARSSTLGRPGADPDRSRP